MPDLDALAEDLMAYLPRSTMFEPVEQDGCVYVFGREILWVVRVRERIDLEAARAAARERGLPRVEWWFGPSAPAGADEEVLAAGLVRDEVPKLTGMTCVQAPPEVPGVEVRPSTPEEMAEVENAVWGETLAPRAADPAVQLFAALVDGRVAGVARSVDFDDGIALMGASVLPDLRGRGAYRALVHARWAHAVARGTPLLVVQAGDMSTPVLDGLGFTRHCELRLFVDAA